MKNNIFLMIALLCISTSNLLASEDYCPGQTEGFKPTVIFDTTADRKNAQRNKNLICAADQYFNEDSPETSIFKPISMKDTDSLLGTWEKVGVTYVTKRKKGNELWYIGDKEKFEKFYKTTFTINECDAWSCFFEIYTTHLDGKENPKYGNGLHMYKDDSALTSINPNVKKTIYAQPDATYICKQPISENMPDLLACYFSDKKDPSKAKKFEVHFYQKPTTDPS